jgi:hypothetical protein
MRARAAERAAQASLADGGGAKLTPKAKKPRAVKEEKSAAPAATGSFVDSMKQCQEILIAQKAKVDEALMAIEGLIAIYQ